MGGWHHWYVIFGNINAYAQALLIYHWEMLLGLLSRLVGYIQIDIVTTGNLHLCINAASHNVTWSERAALVILVHELLTLLVTQNSAVASHRLGNKERRVVSRVIEACRVELHKLHILDQTLGAIHHGDAVASGDRRVGCGLIDMSYATSSHHCNL